MPHAFPTSLVVLGLVAFAAGDVVIAAFCFGSWNQHALLAMPRNRALAEDVSARERGRCWRAEPRESTSEGSCDVGESFEASLDQLGTDADATVLTRAAEHALRCECVTVTLDSTRLVRIRDARANGSVEERARWLDRQLELIATLASATELDFVTETLDFATLAAVRDRDPLVVAHLQATLPRLATLVHAPGAKARRLALAVGRDVIQTTFVELGGSSLRGHDRAARAMEISRALDACTDASRCPALEADDVFWDLVSTRQAIEHFDERMQANLAELARATHSP